jgi:hypothetical protein
MIGAGRLVILCALPLLFTGCAGYRLGSSLPPGIRTVHVPTFVNATGEPELEIRTTRATVQEFQRDGTLRVVGKAESDVVLNVRLVEYRLEPLRYDRNAVKTTSEYRMIIAAEITCRQTRNKQVLTQRRVIGKTTFTPPGGDLATAKLDALPAASRDLAHEVVKCVVEYW